MHRPNGQMFVVPTSNVQLGPDLGPTPQVNVNLGPEIGILGPGDVVTFSYEMHARNNGPVNTTIIRKREDLSWEEVVSNSVKERRFRSGILFINVINY